MDIEWFSDDGLTPLCVAIFSEEYEIVKVLLRYGANPNGICTSGFTPTHAACYVGSKRILKKILEFGGDLNVHDCDRKLPV